MSTDLFQADATRPRLGARKLAGLTTLVVLIVALSVSAASAAKAEIGYDEGRLPSPVEGSPEYVLEPGLGFVDRFDTAVREIAGSGTTGVIRFKPGRYEFRWLEMASNVHVRFDPGVVINLTPPAGLTQQRGDIDPRKQVRLFQVGSKVKNCSVEGPTVGKKSSKMTEIRVPGYTEFVGDRYDLAILGIASQNCSFKNMRFITGGSEGNIIGMGSTTKNVTISNVHARPAADVARYTSVANTPLLPGWSLIQMTAGKNVKLRNLSSYGGVTLRLEQGAFDITNGGGIVNLNARGITAYDSRAAVLLVPQGGVDPAGNKNITIKRVRAHQSGWGVIVGVKTGVGKDNRERVGTFRNTVVDDVKVFGGSSERGHLAQYRFDERWFIPEGLQQQSKDLYPRASHNHLGDPGTFYTGAPLGTIYAPGDYPWIKITNIEPRNFPAEHYKFDSDGHNIWDCFKCTIGTLGN